MNEQKDEKEAFHKSFKNHFALFSLFLHINHSKVIKTVEFYIVEKFGCLLYCFDQIRFHQFDFQMVLF